MHKNEKKNLRTGFLKNLHLVTKKKFFSSLILMNEISPSLRSEFGFLKCFHLILEYVRYWLVFKLIFGSIHSSSPFLKLWGISVTKNERIGRNKTGFL